VELGSSTCCHRIGRESSKKRKKKKRKRKRKKTTLRRVVCDVREVMLGGF